MKKIIITLATLAMAWPLSMVQAKDDKFIPISKGQTWTYQVKANWFNGDSQTMTNENSVVKTQVLDAYKPTKSSWDVYLVKNWPGAFEEIITVITDGNKYYTATAEAFTRIKKGGDVGKEINLKNLFFWANASKGTKFACEDQKRQDNLYCYVLKVKDSKTGVAKIFYNTLPDSQNIEYKKGVGITKFSYKHNGATDNIEFTLLK